MTQNKSNISDYYRQLLNEVLDDIEADVAAIMLQHIGEDNPITGRELVAKLERHYDLINLHRKIRLAIKNLRNKRFLVACSAGNNPGYYLPQNRKEFDAFVNREFTSRIESLVVTKNIMVSTANKVYGPAYQESLI